MGIETQIPSATRQVLLVASPDDISISELITTALQEAGVHVQIADTLTVASRARQIRALHHSPASRPMAYHTYYYYSDAQQSTLYDPCSN